MKEFVFVSDFDGTLTFEDFYEVLINKHLKEKGQRLIQKCMAEKKGVVHFLKTIFGAINCSEQELDDLIYSMPFDKAAIEVIEVIEKFGGDFVILSAGSSYYIDKVLESNNINNVDVIANKGKYNNGKLEMIVDENKYYYSEFYGVDKEKVVQNLRTKYKRLIYAGDSHPDYKAALLADFVFARGMLADMLKDSNFSHEFFEDFHQIKKKLIPLLEKLM